ncbi:hypothetical protein [Thermosporothrix hazakensis]|jgi:hypothetical protein|uniref:hypothetical protein n=1 Tax=Thermosporothrix hazakensis TaxID=644383 RepID=UPI000DAE6A53|nr:hypothetical protein [Thermosporothrix hazakensis]
MPLASSPWHWLDVFARLLIVLVPLFLAARFFLDRMQKNVAKTGEKAVTGSCASCVLGLALFFPYPALIALSSPAVW